MSEGSQTGVVEDRINVITAGAPVEQTLTGSASGAEAMPFAGSTVDPLDVGIASGMKFRVDERYEVDGDAEVVVKGGSLGTTLLRGSILDISTTGCYIQTMARVPIKPGTEVHINFSVYGITFRVEAMSRFAKTKVGIGFRFLEMDPITRHRLHGVLADMRTKVIQSADGTALPSVERTILDQKTD